MWGIIIAIILGWSYFGGSGQQSKVGWDMLSDTLMRNGDLQRVQVVNREVAQVWLKPQAVARYKAQERFRYIPEQGPQFFLNIGSLEKFDGIRIIAKLGGSNTDTALSPTQTISLSDIKITVGGYYETELDND